MPAVQLSCRCACDCVFCSDDSSGRIHVLRKVTTDDDAGGGAGAVSRQHIVVDKCSMLPGIKWQCMVADLQNSFLLQIRTPKGPPLTQPVQLADVLECQDDMRVLLPLPGLPASSGGGGHLGLRLQGRRTPTAGNLAFEITVCVSHVFVDMSGLGLIAGTADILSDELEIVPSPSYEQADRLSSWSFVRQGMLVSAPILPMLYNDYVNSTPAPVVLNGDIDAEYSGLPDGCCFMLPDQGGVWSDHFDVDEIGSVHTVSVPLKSGHTVDVNVEISAGNSAFHSLLTHRRHLTAACRSLRARRRNPSHSPPQISPHQHVRRFHRHRLCSRRLSCFREA